MPARGRLLLREHADDPRHAAMARAMGPWSLVFHARLNAWLDVNGNARVEKFTLKGQLFPLDLDLGPEHIERYVDALVQHLGWVRYEHAGSPYIHNPAFRSEQEGLRVDRVSPECPLPPWPAPWPDGWREAARRGRPRRSAADDGDSGARSDAAGGESPPHPNEAARAMEVESEDQFIGRVIRLANRGMGENKHLGKAVNPIPESHGTSRQTVHDWLAQGIPRRIIAETVYRVARDQYVPTPTHRQINTLSYFTGAVLEADARARANNEGAPDGGNSGGGTPRRSGRRDSREPAAGASAAYRSEPAELEYE